MADKKVFELKEKECLACKAFFREELIDNSNRCPECVKNGTPVGVKAKQDIVQSAEVDYLKLKDMVRKILQELEDEKKEDTETVFAPKDCKICGKQFTPRTPAMTRCDECIEAAKATK